MRTCLEDFHLCPFALCLFFEANQIVALRELVVTSQQVSAQQDTRESGKDWLTFPPISRVASFCFCSIKAWADNVALVEAMVEYEPAGRQTRPNRRKETICR